PAVVDADRAGGDVDAGIGGEGGGVDRARTGETGDQAAIGGGVARREIGRRLAEREGHGGGVGRQVDVAVVDRPSGGRRLRVDREGGAGGGARIVVGLVPPVFDADRAGGDVDAGIGGEGGGVDRARTGETGDQAAIGGDVARREIGRRLAEREGHGGGVGRQ